MVQKHIHKYEAAEIGGVTVIRENGRRKIKRTGKGYLVFKCGYPNCTHYIAAELARGRQTICWLCEQEMVMNAKNMTEKKPHHLECGVKKFGPMHANQKIGREIVPSAIDELMKKLGA